MKNLTVRSRIILGFSAVILIIAGLTGLAYRSLLHIQDETGAMATDSLPGLGFMTQIETAAVEDYSLVQKHVLSEDRQQEQALESQLQTSESKIDDVLKQYEPTINDATDRDLYNQLLQARAQYLTAQNNVIKVSQTAATKAAQTALERQLDPKFKPYRDLIRSEVDYNRRMSNASAVQIAAAVASAQRAVLVGLTLSIVLALISGWLLVQAVNQPLAKVVAAMEPMRRGDLSQRLTLARNDEFGTLAEGLNLLSGDLTALIGQVQKASIDVNSSVTEIAATSRQQQATASEIAAATTEIGATSKEISATSKELVKSMNEVAGVAEQTATLAASGQSGLGRMQSTMQGIMQASSSINARLAVLNEKAGNINTVVTTIAKVADQTNLLSLNAAIEAEKAGEYGRGFAVVATEIRRLADQTAVATLDIETMVKEMQSAVSAGVMGMDKFAEEVRRGVEVAAQVNEQLTQIIEQVQTLTPNFEAVNEGMQSQSLGAQQISDALSQLSEAAQQTVESLRQSNLAIEQTNDSVRGLQSGVSRFMPAA